MMLTASRRTRRSSARPSPHRALRAEVLAALLAKGTPVRPGTVDLVIAAGERLTGLPPHRWTMDDVEALAWFGLVDHAHEVGASLDGLAPAALQLMAVLDPQGRRGLAEAMARLLDPADRRGSARQPA
jgi:hypothetical protein